MKTDKLAHLLDLISAWQVLGVVAIVAAALALVACYHLLARRLADQLPRYRMALLTSVPLFRLLVWIAAILLAVFWALSLPGRAVLAISASVALAVGLAVQDALKSLVAGIIMLFQRPCAVGDMVRVGDDYGEVVAMDLLAIRLRTFGDSLVTVPNARVFSHPVVNSNSGDLREMVVTELTVLGAHDADRALALLEEAARCSPYVDLHRPVLVTVEDATENRRPALRYHVKAYVLDVRDERRMSTDILRRGYRLLREDGAIA